MTKIRAFQLALYSVFILLFNALFFLLGSFPAPASVWIAYGFIHVAYAAMLLSPLMRGRARGSRAFAVSTFGASALYFLLVLGSGLVTILIAPEQFRWALAAQLVLLGGYALLLLPSLIANEYASKPVEKHYRNLPFVQTARKQLEPHRGNAYVQALYELFKQSPTNSNPDLADDEQRILAMVDQLVQAAQNGANGTITALVGDITQALEQRNAQL
ncbi:MAG: hypothetical protein FWD06_09045 [Oscillospiraceae bacterium]|nr:hypothetical protein [Oscillospiraceae bacterium]